MPPTLPSPWADVAPDQLPPMMPFGTMAPTAAPPVFASASPDVVKAPSAYDNEISNDQQHLDKVRWHEANPWGTANNHPGVGGKIAHVLSVAGNIAGDIFAPAATANITGSGLNMKDTENEYTGRLAKDLNDKSVGESRDATTAHEQQETAGLPTEQADRHLQSGATTKNLESEATDRDAAAANPSLATAYAHAVNQAIKEGRDPAQDPIVGHLSDAIVGLQAGQNKPSAIKESQPIIDPKDGKPHVYALDEQGNKVKDLGVHYEKPQVVNVNAAESALDRESTNMAKPYEKGVSDATTQLEKIADARAMINGAAESQALGIPKVLTALVSGAGSGVRITQPELNAIAGARGLTGDVEGTLNSWAGKGKLTDTQKKQLTGILDDVKNRIIQKQAIHSEAVDKIHGAHSRDEIIQADKEARHKLNGVSGGAPSGPPPGADVQVKGKDGNMYWGNSKTREVLGKVTQ